MGGGGGGGNYITDECSSLLNHQRQRHQQLAVLPVLENRNVLIVDLYVHLTGTSLTHD